MRDTALQQKRLLAAAIDIGVGLVLLFALFIVALVVGYAVSAIGHGGFFVRQLMALGMSMVGLVYLLGRDVLGGGRSLGKKSQDIRVITTSGQPITIVDSVKRNAIFAPGSILGVIIAVLGLIPCLGKIAGCLLFPLSVLAAVASVAAAVVEIIKITQDPNGVRFGDEWAGTRVVH
jgi:uncharacterized RDD family membrane protein YckC